MILNDILEITSINWKPHRNDEIEGLGSGQILTAELATPLWTAEVVTPLQTFAEGRKLRAILNGLTKPNKDFFLYDPIGGYPALDPTGSIVAAATVTVHSVVSGQIRLAGLPNGYTLTPGDYFHVEWGTAPVRRGFFEVSVPVTAAVGGTTPLFDVFPYPMSGVVAGVPVTIVKPAMKAKFIPGSVQYPTVDSGTWKMQGFSFTVMQKL